MGPFFAYYPPAILGTFPALYQLLPRARHVPLILDQDIKRPVVDLLDPGLWNRMEWGMTNRKQAKVLQILMSSVHDPNDRSAIAGALQKKMLLRAGAFQRALDRPATAPSGLRMILVAGG